MSKKIDKIANNKKISLLKTYIINNARNIRKKNYFSLPLAVKLYKYDII